MDVSDARDVSTIPELDHREAMALAEVEYRRFADVLADLTVQEWAAPTCCPGWTVRTMAGHVLGAMRSSASLREQGSQLLAARRHGGSLADGLTATQIARTAALSIEEIRSETGARVAAAVRGRSRVPALLRRGIRSRVELPVSGEFESWTLGYLIDQVLTRDVWMHRSDISSATGRTFLSTDAHDGRIVELIVADWASRHQQDFELALSGAVTATFRRGSRPVELSADAVDFCRALSGRGAEVPFGVEVPF
jgi:uncharacterized protein (TIGR03083 family)